MNITSSFRVLLVGVAFFVTLGTAPAQSLIETQTVWRYLADGSDQGTVWRIPAFDDSSWSNGVSLFGVDAPGIYPQPFLTPMPVGGGRITYYFRTHFTWSGSTAGVSLTASNYIDDGAAFYLNGVEAGRVRLTSNPVLFDSLALNQGAEGSVDVLTLSADNLVLGDNVLAVEVHQFTPTSSDIVFGMTLTATTTNSLTLIAAPDKTVACCSGAGTNASAYTVLRSFSTNVVDGRQPRAALMEGRDGALYGTTLDASDSSSGSSGTVYKLNKNGSGYALLHKFGTGGSGGRAPYGRLMEGIDGWLYGTTSGGGSNGAGTIFKMEKNGTNFSVIHSFSTNGGDGETPIAGLMEGSDGAIYGTTSQGGSANHGTVFKLNTNGSSYVVLYSFTNNVTEGNQPWNALMEGRDGALYGTTALGGSNNAGTVFKLNKNGSNYTVLRHFSGTDGQAPYAGLMEGSDGAIYGTTRFGGNDNGGTVFKLNANGGGYTNLHAFSTGNDGSHPYGRLMEGRDGAIYGTTYDGGSNTFGTVYRLNKDGTDYAVLKHFTEVGDGRHPYDGLMEGSDGALYGTTEQAGANSAGTIFRLQPPCSWSFDSPTVVNACCPNATLTVVSTITNGSCPQTITRTWQATDCCNNTATSSQTVTLVDPGFPVITQQPQSQTNSVGSNVTFSVTATGARPLGYQWHFNGTNIPGATNSAYTIVNAQTNDAGIYDVVVFNTLGSIISSPASAMPIPIGEFYVVDVRHVGPGCCWEFDFQQVAGSKGNFARVQATVTPAVVASASGPIGAQPPTWTSSVINWQTPGLGNNNEIETVIACFDSIPSSGAEITFVGKSIEGYVGPFSTVKLTIGDNGECDLCRHDTQPPASCEGFTLRGHYTTWPSDLDLIGHSVLAGDTLKLTDTSGFYQSGVAVLPNLNSLGRIHSFQATFSLYIGGGTTADGFSFNLADTISPPSPYDFIEEGIGTGLSISFDTYDNSAFFPDDIGIFIRSGGPTTAPIAGTGGFQPSGAPGWYDVEITMDSCGKVKVLYDHILFASGTVAYVPGATARFALAARTGARNDNHWVKDLVIITTLSGPDITAAAPANRCCTPVTFTPCFRDNCDPNPTIVCVPASGSCFPIGATRVCCTATDSAGNQSQYGFYVFVTGGPPPPSITCPADMALSIVGNDVQVTYPAPTVTGGTLVGCTPPSGSTFSLGTTLVTCTATNICGTTTNCTFRVNVQQLECGRGANLVRNGSFEEPLVTANMHDEHLNGQTGVPGWTTGQVGQELEIWNGNYGGMMPSELQQHLKLGANTAERTVRQVVANVSPGCLATFCFDYTGRPNGIYNHFRVEVTDGSGILLTVDRNPAAYTPAGGWTHFSATFTPLLPPVTISFISDIPPTGEPGAAHIDNVSLWQCCLVIDCPTDIVLNCQDDRGAFATYGVPTASSACCPGPVNVNCMPPPGEFPIGVTQVTCTTVDACFKTNKCSFSVTVRGHGSDARGQWMRKGGTLVDDHGNAVAVDAKGNVFVTGFYNGSMVVDGSITLAPFGANDVFLAKYNSAGVLQWAVRAGGSGQDAGYGVATDNEGNAYVTGEFTGGANFESWNDSANRSLGSSGGRDIFVAKYDPSGVCRWAYSDGGGQGHDRGAGIAVRPDGSEVLVTGDWSGSTTPQVFVLKLTGAGAFSGRVVSTPGSADPNQFARARSIALDSTGNAYVAGLYVGPSALTLFQPSTLSLPASASPRVFAAKFNPALLCLWIQHSGHGSASGAHDGMGIAVDPTDAFCYVTAYFNGTADFGGSAAVTDTKNTVSNGQLNDYLIAKLETGNNGAAIWAIKGGGASTSDDESRGIAMDPDGNLCVTGFQHPGANSVLVNEGPTVLVASYSAAGNHRWTANPSAAVPATDEVVGLGIAVDKAGCVQITGAFSGGLNFPDLNFSLASFPFDERDMFVGKICPTCCSSTNLIGNGSFETPLTTLNSVPANNTFSFPSAVPGWITTDSNHQFEIWSGSYDGITASQAGNQNLEINANDTSETVSQVVAGLDPKCLTTLCFYYTGRYGTPAQNTFSVQLSGPGFTTLSPPPFTPASYANGGWQKYSTAPFYPPSTLTIAFHGTPVPGVDGGAHIDDVSLTQNCCSAPPPCSADPMLTIARSGPNIVVTWTGPGYLEAAENLLFFPVPWVRVATKSPYVTSAIPGGFAFFRVVCP